MSSPLYYCLAHDNGFEAKDQGKKKKKDRSNSAFCERAEKHEKKDISFIGLTFAAFQFCSEASPGDGGTGGSVYSPCANLGPIYVSALGLDGNRMKRDSFARRFALRAVPRLNEQLKGKGKAL